MEARTSLVPGPWSSHVPAGLPGEAGVPPASDPRLQGAARKRGQQSQPVSQDTHSEGPTVPLKLLMANEAPESEATFQRGDTTPTNRGAGPPPRHCGGKRDNGVTSSKARQNCVGIPRAVQ